MPDSGYPEIFGPDLTPVRAKDLVAIAKGAMDRPGATPQDGDDDEDRGVLGEAVEMSTAQFAEAAVTFAALWEYVEWFQAEENKKPRGAGRPREHSVAQAVLVWMMKPEEMSERAIIVELRDHWPRICAAAVAAWPDHPNRRMPDRPISRGQYRRFASRHLANDPEAHQDDPEARKHCREVHERLVFDMMRAAAKAARHIGMLDPSDGSPNRPSPSRTIYGDETFIRDRFNRKPSECFNAKGKQIHRFNPDSRVRYTNNPKDKGTRGYKVFTLSVRNDWVNQRIILVTGVRDKGVTEANNIIDQLGLLRGVCPEVRDGANTATYDGAVHSVQVSRRPDPTQRRPRHPRHTHPRLRGRRRLRVSPAAAQCQHLPPVQRRRHMPLVPRHRGPRQCLVGASVWGHSHPAARQPPTRTQTWSTPQAHHRVAGSDLYQPLLPAGQGQTRGLRIHQQQPQSHTAQPTSPQHHHTPCGSRPARIPGPHHDQRAHPPLLRERRRHQRVLRPAAPDHTPPAQSQTTQRPTKKTR